MVGVAESGYESGARSTDPSANVAESYRYSATPDGSPIVTTNVASCSHSSNAISASRVGSVRPTNTGDTVHDTMGDR